MLSSKKYLEKIRNIRGGMISVISGSLISYAGTGGPVPVARYATAGNATSTAAAWAKEKQLEGTEEESAESDDDMGFDLFD